MLRRGSILALVIGVTTMLLLGCSSSSPSNEGNPGTGKLTVYVVNYPLKYFAQRIGGEHVEVVFPAPPDQDPAFWRPDAKTIEAYQQADLILLNGANYAKWVSTVSLPSARVVNTSARFTDQYLKVDDAVVHTHGPEGKHSHAGIAFTTWLDPRLAIQQAEAIRQALTKHRPQHGKTFEEGFNQLRKDLEQLDRKIEETVQRARDRPVTFSHPVYQYLTKRYHLKSKSVHWEPDEILTSKMWNELKKLRETHPALWMIWEGEPKEETVKQLAKVGIQSVVFNPCGSTPDSADYLEVMQFNVKALSLVFAGQE